MFLPTMKSELKKLGWEKLDVILVSGDAYIDHPSVGVAVIGKLLLSQGYKVGVIAQPNPLTSDIGRLGEPELFWGVSSGCVDSMVSNYTALKKKRNSDDFTPGNINNKRPDRAVIIYSNLIRNYFKNTKPIILGGVEASLRRIAHYDDMTEKLRRSILFDSKANILVYGMGERAITEIADCLKNNKDWKNTKGICYISSEPKADFIELPSFDEVTSSKLKFIDMFNTFYKNQEPVIAKGLNQKYDNRYLIHNPPADYLTSEELDKVNELEYERDVHPLYKALGEVKAILTFQFSITSHRGCFGRCNFCSIAIHQGSKIISRSKESIIREAESFVKHKDFKGNISDVGGPSANMYGMDCKLSGTIVNCGRNCISSGVCKNLKLSHRKQIELLKELKKIKGIKKVFIASGVRYDLVVADSEHGKEYLNSLVNEHISGQMKIAPEHLEDKVLKLMGKPKNDELLTFKNLFNYLNNKIGKKQYLTYYFIAAHPGCTENDMYKLKKFTSNDLRINPEQVQVFTPTPSTYSTLMYYTGLNPWTLEEIFVEKGLAGKKRQRDIVISKY